VSLVGVAHIGQASLYRRLQEILDAHDVVLFESVKPAGAGEPGGQTDEQRIESTRRAIRFVASVAELHQARKHDYPIDHAALLAYAGSLDARLKWFVEQALTDAWGRPVRYSRAEDGYRLLSLGADGEPGGEGVAADIVSPAPGSVAALQATRDDGLQAELARTLGLRFQLDDINYDRPNWHCSDMAIDQVNRALAERGLDAMSLEAAMEGSSFPARLIRVVLGLVRLMNWLSDGAAADMIKVMLIELLGDEAIIEQALRQHGRGFSEVIVEQRNAVVIDDLARLIEREPRAGSVAIFYGSAHMPDLAARLAEQLQYQPAGEPEWISAISVDLAESRLTRRDVQEMRRLLRQSLRAQLGPPRSDR
jgi:hypothetical protein